MNIEVQKEDIERIGKTIFCGEDGTLCIVSDGNVANIEYILLHNILKCFGDYEIISEEDYCEEYGDEEDWSEDGILFVTNMPYSLYESLHKK